MTTTATRTRRPRTPDRLPELTADERRARELQKLEVQIGGLCYSLLDIIGDHQIPASAEPLRAATVRAYYDRHPITYGRRLRELMGRLAELTDVWEYNGGDHHYRDDDDQPYPAEQLFPELLAQRAVR